MTRSEIAGRNFWCNKFFWKKKNQSEISLEIDRKLIPLNQGRTWMLRLDSWENVALNLNRALFDYQSSTKVPNVIRPQPLRGKEEFVKMLKLFPLFIDILLALQGPTYGKITFVNGLNQMVRVHLSPSLTWSYVETRTNLTLRRNPQRHIGSNRVRWVNWSFKPVLSTDFQSERQSWYILSFTACRWTQQYSNGVRHGPGR